MKIYFDGGCKPNPGTMEICYVDTWLNPYYRKLEYGTNNQAEWLAFLAAIRYAAGFNEPTEILGDSKLVIEQFYGRWKCNDAILASYRDEARQFASIIDNLTVKWIGRKDNLAGQHLESLYK